MYQHKTKHAMDATLSARTSDTIEGASRTLARDVSFHINLSPYFGLIHTRLDAKDYTLDYPGVVLFGAESQPLACFTFGDQNGDEWDGVMYPNSTQDDDIQHFHGQLKSVNTDVELSITNLCLEGDINFSIYATDGDTPRRINKTFIVKPMQSIRVDRDQSTGALLKLFDDDDSHDGLHYSLSVVPQAGIQSMQTAFEKTQWRCVDGFRLEQPKPIRDEQAGLGLVELFSNAANPIESKVDRFDFSARSRCLVTLVDSANMFEDVEPATFYHDGAPVEPLLALIMENNISSGRRSVDDLPRGVIRTPPTTRMVCGFSHVKPIPKQTIDNASRMGAFKFPTEECCVCLDAVPCVILSPCGHVCLCDNLAHITPIKKCPICKVNIRKAIRL